MVYQINQVHVLVSNKTVITRYFILLAMLLLGSATLAQDTTLVRIHGQVSDPTDPVASFNLMVVNKRLGTGTFGNTNGTFSISVRKCDTILVGSVGYETQPIVMCDSAMQSSYTVNIELKRLQVRLREVFVLPERDLKEIKQDVDDLGYNERDYRISGIDAASSPITFLYQKYSRRERQLREAYKLENEIRKRDLLKELFRKYVNYNIIDLAPEDFDNFIDFCNVSDEFMRHTSQYDFIMYIKKKYELWLAVNDYRPETRPSREIQKNWNDN